MSNFLKARNLRLRREYQELLSSPVANCSAQPLEEDIAVWHANIYVPGLELTFHFEISYPTQYPNKAPKIKNFTHISHPNVFGDYICLDILTMSEETANTPFRGWTSAYTISSLLIQLQSFLFEAVSTDGYAARRMAQDAATFVCSKCGHSTHYPVPEITCFENGREDAVCEVIDGENQGYFFLDDCSNLVLALIFEFIDQETLGKLCFLLGDVTDVTDLAFARRTYKCYYTLTTLNDERVVFGLGAKRAIMPRRSRKTGYKENKLQQLHCSFDFLSHDAFKMGVRNNIWKDRDFDCFIPLYINAKHGRRAIVMAEEYILNIWNCADLPTNYRKVTANLVLETLSKLMNTTVVNMMKTVEDLEAGELQLFDSIKALKGYTSMHHLLLAFCDRYPAIPAFANAQVKKFISDPLARDKETTPDIGELLICLAISDYSWDDFSPAWIEEVFIRNARWILSKYPNLFKKEKGPSCIRMTQSFHATRTGKRLAMFQRFFISEVASPERLRGNASKNKVLLKEYNERLGLPPRGMAEKLQEHSRKVIACDNWWDYFTLVDFCVPSAAHLSAWLRSSVEVSSLKEYHNKRQILRYPENFVSQPSETIQCETRHCLCAGSLYKLPENCAKIGESTETNVTLVKKKRTGVDICFVMDCTGSMGSWIDSAKKSIQQIIKRVTEKCEHNVRFAIAGYRDHHGQGSGSDQYVVKKFDFTKDPKIAEKRVQEYKAAGGADYPEAMCCAMKAAAEMTWNRDSHQIVITIADAPPHGLSDDLDDYPDGCPCGADSLRIAHTMKQNGIVIYTVDCGREDPIRETFFHALAQITGGYALNMTDASLLPDIVLGACVEEDVLDSLTKTIKPLYMECIESHPLGRFEQYCQSVYSQCKAKKVKIQSCLPADGYDKNIAKQIDHLVFCTDLKQAKKMGESEYFAPIKRKTKLCSYMKRPVSLSQVTRCMKRMETKLANETFLKNGCQYLTSDRFSMEDFKVRWTNFKSERKIRKFSPWNRLSGDQKNTYSRIPSPIKMTSEPLKPLRDLIHHNLIGRTIEVDLHKVWTRVKIIKLLRGGKVLVSFKNIEFPIEEAKKWRPASALASWGNAKKIEGPEASPILLRQLNLIPSGEKKKEEAVMNATAPAVVPTPVPVLPCSDNVAPGSRIAVPSASDDSGRSRSHSFGHNFVVNQLIRCKNKETEDWKLGVVVSVVPLLVRLQKDGPTLSCRYVAPANLDMFTLNCSTPVVSQPGGVHYSQILTAGTQVRSLEIVNGFAHIISPVIGWVDSQTCIEANADYKNESKAPERTAVSNRMNLRSAISEPTQTVNVPPTLNIYHVHERLSARDLANICMNNGVTPKNIRKVMTEHGIMAKIQFATHEDAKFMHALRCLSHAATSTHMPVQWSEEYINPNVNATKI